MKNFEKSTYGKEGFFYGDNFSESGVLTADAEVKMEQFLFVIQVKNGFLIQLQLLLLAPELVLQFVMLKPELKFQQTLESLEDSMTTG